MKAVGKTLINEIQLRISLIEEELEKLNNRTDEERIIYLHFAREHFIYSEVLKLAKYFKKVEIVNNQEKEKYTPIKCSETGAPLFLGDKVEINRGQSTSKCGYLEWDDHFNEYLVKPEDGIGHSRGLMCIYKINELYNYKIDTSRIECRKGRG